MTQVSVSTCWGKLAPALMLACALAMPAHAAQTASGAISGAGTPTAAVTDAKAATSAANGGPAADAATVPAASAPEASPATSALTPAAAPVTSPEQQAALLGARPATPMPAPSATGSLLQTTFSLLLVLAILVGLAWLLKRYGPKTITGNANVKLVGALSVGARERILVVEVGEQWIVVGASPGRMNALATMPRQEGDILPPEPGHALPSANFAEWFKQTIEKRHGK